MEQLEVLKIIALPGTIIFLGLWLSSAIEKLASALNGSPTDNYEIALRLTKEIYAKSEGKSNLEKEKVEEEILGIYTRVLQKAADIDYEEKK